MFLHVRAEKKKKKKEGDLQHIRLQSKLVELGSNISREKEIPLSLREAFLPQVQSDKKHKKSTVQSWVRLLDFLSMYNLKLCY